MFSRLSKQLPKRLFAVAIALCMLFVSSIGVFAADSQTPNDEEISVASAGKIIATNAATIRNGNGVLYVTLTSGNYFADVDVCLGYAPENNKVVTVHMTDPKGNSYSLGSIAGTGSRTSMLHLTYASAGTYTFHFAAAMSEFEVAAFIYD